MFWPFSAPACIVVHAGRFTVPAGVLFASSKCHPEGPKAPFPRPALKIVVFLYQSITVLAVFRRGVYNEWYMPADLEFRGVLFASFKWHPEGPKARLQRPALGIAVFLYQSIIVLAIFRPVGYSGTCRPIYGAGGCSLLDSIWHLGGPKSLNWHLNILIRRFTLTSKYHRKPALH